MGFVIDIDWYPVYLEPLLCIDFLSHWNLMLDSDVLNSALTTIQSGSFSGQTGIVHMLVMMVSIRVTV